MWGADIQVRLEVDLFFVEKRASMVMGDADKSIQVKLTQLQCNSGGRLESGLGRGETKMLFWLEKWRRDPFSYMFQVLRQDWYSCV